MLPFVTKRDLEQAAQTAHVSRETRNLFLNKMLSEHSQTGIRLQLQTLWTEWVAKTCDEQLVPEVSGSLGMEAATPPDDDDEMFTAAGGCGGSGEYCWLTVNALVHFAPPPPAAPAGP